MAKAFDFRKDASPIDMSAKRVGQREVLYLGQGEIQSGVAIGTDNIQQCCVLVWMDMIIKEKGLLLLHMLINIQQRNHLKKFLNVLRQAQVI